MATVHELGDLTALAEGDMRCFPELGEWGVLVLRVDGDLHAVDDNCSQCDKPLNRGVLVAHSLTCTEHEEPFDVRDGSPSGHPAPAPIGVHRLDGPEHAVRLLLG